MAERGDDDGREESWALHPVRTIKAPRELGGLVFMFRRFVVTKLV